MMHRFKETVKAGFGIIKREIRRPSRELIAKAGQYAALAALLVLLGVASSAYRNRKEVPAPDPKPDNPSVQAFALPTPAATPEPKLWVWPLEGQVIGEYAPSTPVWSETLGQWQTHPAIDISGDPGEAVRACADGTVSDAWKDPLWGNVIVIEHADGAVSTYAGLNTLNLVEPGQAVFAGDVISSVGSSAACEASLPSHLHFALSRDGVPVDFEALMEGTGTDLRLEG